MGKGKPLLIVMFNGISSRFNYALLNMLMKVDWRFLGRGLSFFGDTQMPDWLRCDLQTERYIDFMGAEDDLNIELEVVTSDRDHYLTVEHAREVVSR